LTDEGFVIFTDRELTCSDCRRRIRSIEEQFLDAEKLEKF